MPRRGGRIRPGPGCHVAAEQRTVLLSMIRQRPLFAEHHCWFVLVGTLDLLLTKVILSLGGRELNPLADLVLRQFDTPGLAALKYSTIIIVVLTCERVGRAHARAGRRLALTAVGLSAVPVMVASGQLINFGLVAVTTR